MNKLLASTAAVALVIGLNGPAHADCKIGSANTVSDADRAVHSSETRRDLRQLRNAAQILNSYGKNGVCEDIVSVIEDIRNNPESAHAKDGAAKTPDTAAKNPDPNSYQAEYKKRFSEAKPIGDIKGNMRLEQLMDADIVGSDGSTIGEIEDVVMMDSGKPGYVILGFGGFLGMGEEQAAVPFSQLRVTVDEDGDRTYYLPMTAEQLEKAPKFKRGDEKWMADEEWRQTNDKFYQG